MNNISQTFKLSTRQTNGLQALQLSLQQWWHALPIGLRSPIWPGLLATLIIVAMLLAFHQVVRGAVQQGELQHQASALHSAATWRCNNLRGAGASSSCLLQLNSTVLATRAPS